MSKDHEPLTDRPGPEADPLLFGSLWGVMRVHRWACAVDLDFLPRDRRIAKRFEERFPGETDRRHRRDSNRIPTERRSETE